MANINESIEQLTASLQELAVQTYNHVHAAEPLPGKVAVAELKVSGMTLHRRFSSLATRKGPVASLARYSASLKGTFSEPLWILSLGAISQPLWWGRCLRVRNPGEMSFRQLNRVLADSLSAGWRSF